MDVAGSNPAAATNTEMKIVIGVVAVDKKFGKPHTGAAYSAGAKVYKSEKMARSARKRNPDDYDYVPAYIDLPDVAS